MVPPVKSVLRFHATFFVSFSRCAKRRRETPVRPERDEALGLFPLVAPENLLHRTLEIVETQQAKHPTKIREGQLVCFQKRLLAGVRIGSVKRPPAGHTPQTEYVGF